MNEEVNRDGHCFVDKIKTWNMRWRKESVEEHSVIITGLFAAFTAVDGVMNTRIKCRLTLLL